MKGRGGGIFPYDLPEVLGGLAAYFAPTYAYVEACLYCRYCKETIVNRNLCTILIVLFFTVQGDHLSHGGAGPH